MTQTLKLIFKNFEIDLLSLKIVFLSLEIVLLNFKISMSEYLQKLFGLGQLHG